MLVGADNKPLQNISNVDVQYAYGKYWLTGNTFVDGKPLKTNIFLYLSLDGIHFTPFDGGDGLIMPAISSQVITPHLMIKSANKFALIFGFGLDFFTFGSGTMLGQWNYNLQK